MKRIRNAIAFCMVLLLLPGLTGCAEPSVSSYIPSSSAESSAEQSSQSEPEIEPYVITPLETPMNGGMTYEEYFSIEREMKIIQEKDRQYVTPYGTLRTAEHEIFLERDGESLLLYRSPERMWWYTVDENWIMWQQQEESSCLWLYRIYLPTLYCESIYASADLYGYDCLTSTDIRLMETRFSKIDGQMCMVTTVYSQLTERLYLVEFHHGDKGLREAYLAQRNQDIETIKRSNDKEK